MKKINYLIILVLTLLLPIKVLAHGNISLSTDKITMELNSTTNFQIIANNSAGELKIKSENDNITLNKTHEWIDLETLDVSIKANKIGTTKIIVDINAATYSEEVLIETKTIEVNVIDGKSNNNNLKNLMINGQSIANFNKNTTTYTIDDINLDEIEISATAEDSKSKIEGLGIKTLKYGLNIFNIVVTSENLEQKTYTINIKKKQTKSSDNSLENLTLTPGDIKFDSNKTVYSLIVDNYVKEIKINGKTNNSKATVIGFGVKKLNIYNNKFNIVVTAEDGSKKTYTIEVIRKDELGNTKKLSSNNKLSSLTIKDYVLDFKEDQEVYYLDVSNGVTNLEVIAKSSDSKAIVQIDNPNLVEGENTITIKVTSEDGSIKTYKIIVNKKSKEISNILVINIKDDNNIVTRETLNSVKTNNQKLIINKYENGILLYSWEIQGRDIKEVKDINTLIDFKVPTDKKLNELLKESKYLYFNNSLDTSMFNNITLKLYVDDKFNNENIYGYSYENGSLVKEYDNLKYTNRIIELKNIESGIYVITDEDINQDVSKINVRLIIILIILIILLLVILNIIQRKSNDELKNKK